MTITIFTIPTMIPPVAPQHAPERSGPRFDLLAQGGVADGRTLNTSVLQAAIDRCTGGGTVTLGPGIWRTGGLHLVSGLTLQLSAGAVLLGSDDWRDYGSGQWRDSLLSAEGAEGIRIIGPGIIDGADCFNPAGEGGNRGPHGIWLDRCRDIVVRDVTLRNIGNWGVAAWRCTDLTFERYDVRGGHDGIDIENCRRVLFDRCRWETGDDCIAGPGNSDVRVVDCVLNSSCNGIRVSCERMLIQRCRFEGPGRYEHRFTGGRTNTLTALVQFSPHERGYRGRQPHSDHWLVEDCVIDGIDAIFEYDHGHVWQDGRCFGSIVFRGLRATGFCTPLIVYGSMVGYRRECRVYLDACELETRVGAEDCGYFDLRRYGALGLRDVVLRGNGASKPIRALDGGPVEIENLRVEVRAVAPAATLAEALRGVSTFVFPTPDHPADPQSPAMDSFAKDLAGATPSGDLRDGVVRGRLWSHRGGEDCLVLWSLAPNQPVAVRGQLTAARRSDGAAVPPMTSPFLPNNPGESPNRGAVLCFHCGAEPVLLRGTGLEIVTV